MTRVTWVKENVINNKSFLFMTLTILQLNNWMLKMNAFLLLVHLFILHRTICFDTAWKRNSFTWYSSFLNQNSLVLFNPGISNHVCLFCYEWVQTLNIVGRIAWSRGCAADCEQMYSAEEMWIYLIFILAFCISLPADIFLKTYPLLQGI